MLLLYLKREFNIFHLLPLWRLIFGQLIRAMKQGSKDTVVCYNNRRESYNIYLSPSYLFLQMVIITTSFSKEESIKETAARWRQSRFLPTSLLGLFYISRVQGFQELFLTYTDHWRIRSYAGKTADGWQMILKPALTTREGLVYRTRMWKGIWVVL